MLIWGSIGLYPLIYWIRDLLLDNFDIDSKKIVNYSMKWRNDITKFGSAFFECKFFRMAYLVNLIVEFSRRQVNEVTFQIHKNKPTQFKPPFFCIFLTLTMVDLYQSLCRFWHHTTAEPASLLLISLLFPDLCTIPKWGCYHMIHCTI